MFNLVLQGINKILGGPISANSLNVSSGGTTAINTSTITTTNGQTYNNPVVLGENATLTGGGANAIQFANTIESAASGGSSSGYGLTLNQTGGAAGSVIFGGTVGLANALGYLTVTSTGNIALNGPSITTSAIGTSSGTQQYIGPVLLGINTALSSVVGGDIIFNNTIKGGFGLTLDAAGNVIFNGTVGAAGAPLRYLSVTGNQIDINTGTITTTAGQLYNSPIILGTNVLFTDTGSNPIEFAAIDSLTGTSYALNVAKTGTGGVIFGGEVGSVNAPGSLNVSSAGAIAINTTAINTVGEQVYGGNVALGENAALTTGTGGNVSFGGTVNGGSSLNVSSGGEVTFGGNVGIGTSLTSLNVVSSGNTNINAGTINTVGEQVYNGSGSVVLSGISPTVNMTSTSGPISFNQDINAGNRSLTISAGGTLGNIGLQGISGVFNLVLQGINKILGGPISANSLNVSSGGTTAINTSTITTTNGQTYNNPVVLGENATLTGGGANAIQFANTIESAASGGSSSGYGLTVNQTGGAAGSVIFGGTVGLANALGYLTVTSTGNIALNGPSITTSAIGTSSGTQQYIGPVLLGINTALSSVVGGDIIFNNTIKGGFGLTLDAAGNVIFNGTVGAAGAPLRYLSVTGNQIDINTGTITTTGGQIYSSPIVLGTSVLFTDTGSNPIEFAAIDSLTGTSYALNVAKTGTGGVIFGGEVGSVNAPGSLNVSSAGAIAINTTAINTVGEQVYGGNVALGENAALTTGTGGNVSFGGTVNGGSSLNVSSGGEVTFGGNVGIGTSLTSLNVVSSGNTNINAGTINTVGEQVYNGSGSVVLSGISPTVNMTSTSGPISFNQDINAGNRSLTISAGGTLGNIGLQGISGVFNLVLQGINKILGGPISANSLNVSSGGTTAINTSTITTTNGQTYNNPVVLGENATLTGGGANAIQFANTIESAASGGSSSGYGLTLNQTGGAAGSVIFGGTVGLANALGYLTVTSTGNIALNGPSITTSAIGTSSGTQQYIGPVLLGINTALSSVVGGDIIFNNTIKGGFGLTLDAAGNVIFNGTVGAAGAPLRYLSVTGNQIDINTGTITTTAGQLYNSPIILGTNVLFTDTGSSPIEFAAIDSLTGTSYALNVAKTGTGGVIFGGEVGSVNAPGSLNVSSAGAIAINTTAINTVGEQVYGGNVALGENAALTTGTGGNVSFGGTVNGGSSLNVSSGGEVTFGGNVGVGTSLTSLNVVSSGNTNINAGTINTVGEQVYNGSGSVVLSGISPTVNMTSTSGPISFNQDINAGNRSLTISAGGILGNISLQGISGVFNLVLQGINKILGGPISANTLNIGSGGVTSINTNTTTITTVNSQTYGGAVALSGTAPTTFTTTNNGAIEFQSSLTGNNQNVAFSSGTGTTTLNGPVSTVGNLQLQGTGISILSGNISNVGSISTPVTGETHISAPSITTSGNQTYSNLVTLFGNTTLGTTSGNVVFTTNINGGFGLTLDAAGNVIFGGPVNIGSLNVTGNRIDINTGTITTAGGQIYSSPIILGTNVLFTDTGSSPIEFAAIDSLTGTSYALNVAKTGTGGVIFGGEVGSVNAPSSLNVSSAGAIAINTTAINAVGEQVYGGNVALGENAALTTGTGGNVSFGGTVNGGSSLNVSSGGEVTFGGNVGVGTSLTSLNVVSSGNTNINAGTINTVGEQVYGGNVVLGGASTNINLSSTNGPITFSNNITGSSQNLTLNAGGTLGNISLQGISGVFNLVLQGINKILGGPISANSLNVSSGGTTAINTSTITTTNGQTYNNPVVLGANATLTGGGANGIEFANTVDTSSGTNYGLNVVKGGTGGVTFGGQVGSTNAPEYLNVSASSGGIAIGTNAITTIGNQTYNGSVVLSGASPTSFTTSGGNITFTSNLTGGGQNVKLNSGNGETILGSVTGINDLELLGVVMNILGGPINISGSLSTTTSGETRIGTSSITTGENQIYNNLVRLLTDTTLETSNGNVTFANAIEGGLSASNTFALNIDANGNVIFGGNVGPTYYLKSLSVDAGTGKIYFGTDSGPATININTIGSQSYLNPVVLKSDAILTATSPTIGNIEFLDTVNSNQLSATKNLTVNAAGSAEFTEAVGGVPLAGIAGVPLNNLFVTGGGNTTITGQGITTTGSQTYNNAVHLGSQVSFEAGGNIAFNSKVVDLPGFFSNMILDAGGNIQFTDVGTYAYPIDNIFIRNAVNVNSSGVIYATSFTQAAGAGSTNLNYLYLGTGGTGTYNPVYPGGAGIGTGTGAAIIINNEITATVDVGSLVLGSSLPSVHIYGFIAGKDYWDALQFITTVQGYPIGQPNTYYYDYIDLFGKLPQEEGLNYEVIDLMLLALKANYGLGFSFNYTLGSSEWDYMFMLEPLDCEISTEG